MNRRNLPFIILALLILAAGGLLLPGTFSGDDPLQASTATIDPAIWEALETETEVEVLISLESPDAPIEEWTRELQQTNAAERQARVLAELSDKDFTLQHQFETAAALSGLLTKSGLSKLAVHPDVAGIAMNREDISLD